MDANLNENNCREKVSAEKSFSNYISKRGIDGNYVLFLNWFHNIMDANQPFT